MGEIADPRGRVIVIGREPLLGELGRILESPVARVLLVGDPGIGKTTVWTAALDRVPNSVARWELRCFEAEQDVGLTVLAGLYDLIPNDIVESLPTPQRRAVDGVLYRDPGPLEGAPLNSRLLGQTTLSVLRAAAQQSELLLAVDDLQWCDPVSEAALSFALRRCDNTVRVLATSRRESSPISDVVRVELPPLDHESIQRLVHLKAGRATTARQTEEVARASLGNPFCR